MKSNINRLIDGSGYTVTEMAERAGISRTIASELKNAKALPDKTRLDVLERMASVFGVPISSLFLNGGIEITSVEHLPVIVAASVPTTARQRNNAKTADYMEQKLFGGFFLLTLKGISDPLVLSYTGTSMGYISMEIVAFVDESILLNKKFKDAAGIDTDRLHNSSDVINDLSPRAMQYIADKLQGNPDVKELQSQIQKEAPLKMEVAEVPFSLHSQIDAYPEEGSSFFGILGGTNSNCYLMKDFFDGNMDDWK